MEYFTRSKREKEEEKNVLVGAPVPTHISDYLNLFCVADSCSKTSIVRPLIEKWVKKSQEKFPVSKLIEIVAANGYESHKNTRKKFVSVLKKQKKELIKRNINESTIDEILKKIIYAKSQED